MDKLLLVFLLVCGITAKAQEEVDTEVLLNFNLAEMTINGKVGDKIRLENLNFIGGSDKLLPESEPVLEELLQVLTDNPKLKIQIQGHVCCYRKDPADISRKRAKAIYKYLIEKGIKKRRLSFKSFEGKKPLFSIPEDTEEEKAANRRVEIEIIEK